MARRQLGTAPSNTADTATKGYVDTATNKIVTTDGAQTLTFKTISGASNTVTDLPASATPNAARKVGTTAAGGNGAQNGANTWAKIATVELSERFNNPNFVLAIAGSTGDMAETVIVAFSPATSGYSANGFAYIDVQILASSGSNISALKAVSSGTTNATGQVTTFDLWMKKAQVYGNFTVYELNCHIFNTARQSITYYSASAWQSAEPTGTITATATGSNPRINTIYDGNGVPLTRFSTVTNAANFLAISNNISGGRPSLLSEGTDTNIGFAIVPKGTGDIQLYQPTGSVTLSATGNDTNVGINITTKGTGIVQANGNPVGVKVAVPSTATSTGVQGQWAADSSYIYVCTATNTWRRAAIASW